MKALESLGTPTGVAAAVTVIATAAIIAGGAALLTPGLQEWLERAPEIAQTLEQKARPLKEWLTSVQEATAKLEQVTKVPDSNATPPVAPVQNEGGGGH